jgi:hypothetical protein
MTYELMLGEDGILRATFIGNTDKEEAEAYHKDMVQFLELSSEEKPLHLIVYVDRAGKFSAEARKSFSRLNEDPRMGNIAYLGANRFVRVITGFVLKASGRHNMRFFDSETQAVTWLKT